MKTNKLSIISFTLIVLLFTTSQVLAGTGTISIWGTNVSTAQANVSIQNAPQNVTVIAWNVNGTKTFAFNVTNTSTLIILIANNTVSQIDEILVNSSSINGAQVNSSGWFNYTYTFQKGIATVTIRPSINQGGYNTVWAWIQYLTVVTQTTINNVIITNTTNLNATNITGGGAGISQLNTSNLTNQPWINKTDTINASNLTDPIAAVNGSAVFGLNMSNQTTCRGNVTCTYNANGSLSLDAVSNLTAIFNLILNSSTVTAGVYPNGTVELTATAATTTTNAVKINITPEIVGFLTPPSESLNITPLLKIVDSMVGTGVIDIGLKGNMTYDLGYSRTGYTNLTITSAGGNAVIQLLNSSDTASWNQMGTVTNIGAATGTIPLTLFNSSRYIRVFVLNADSITTTGIITRTWIYSN